MGEIIKNGEIDLIKLFKFLWRAKWVIIKITLAFFVVGLTIAMISPPEYKASVSIMPQTENMTLGRNLGPLASMAGINIGGSSGNSDIPPAIYPKLTNSILFKKKILETELDIGGINESVTFKEYYETYYDPGVGFKIISLIRKYTLGLPKIILGSLTKVKDGISRNQKPVNESESELLKISEFERILFERVEGQIEIEVNEILGVITISGSMPEPIAAAQLTQKAMELLQQAIIEYRINKARNKLEFHEERVKERSEEVENVRQQLATFKERNRDVSSLFVMNELEKIQNEYDLVFGVYSDLLHQLETSKIQVKQDTPTFSIIDPVYVPYERSKPRVVLITGLWTLIGLFVGSLIALIVKVNP